jgi:hypothetical protein
MQQNDESIKQLKFIADMYPKVFMNTSLGLAIAEIKKIIESHQQEDCNNDSYH